MKNNLKAHHQTLAVGQSAPHRVFAKKSLSPSYGHSQQFALLFMIIGGSLLLFHGLIQDYAFGIFAADGIYIPNPSHTFPRQEGGGSLSHTFRIYNLRPRRLSVRVQPDCGCTSVSWKSTTIAPFGWRDLAATMEPKKRTLADQQQWVGIAIGTDSPAKPYLFAFLAA